MPLFINSGREESLLMDSGFILRDATLLASLREITPFIPTYANNLIKSPITPKIRAIYKEGNIIEVFCFYKGQKGSVVFSLDHKYDAIIHQDLLDASIVVNNLFYSNGEIINISKRFIYEIYRRFRIDLLLNYPPRRNTLAESLLVKPDLLDDITYCYGDKFLLSCLTQARSGVNLSHGKITPIIQSVHIISPQTVEVFCTYKNQWGLITFRKLSSFEYKSLRDSIIEVNNLRYKNGNKIKVSNKFIYNVFEELI